MKRLVLPMLVFSLVAGTSAHADDRGDRDGRGHAWGQPAGTGAITLIHTGDFHGHLVPRPNVRSDARGHRMEGGLARIYTKIKEIRGEEGEHDHRDEGSKKTLLLHTGDTIQGSAETLFTRGQAIVDVLNLFRIDAYAPGNWEFVYGTQRFIDLFVGANGQPPLAPWGTVGANVYYDPNGNGVRDPGENTRVLPPYLIKQVGSIKVGILGLTTDRGPQVVGRSVTKGLYFLKNTATELDAEVQAQVNQLRNVERVDLLVMLSEMGLANNIRIAEKIPGIDVIFSSDMHEETREAVVTAGGTIISEVGQDGTSMARLKLHLRNGKIEHWKYKFHTITSDIPEDRMIAKKVREARSTFVAGDHFTSWINPFNGSKLKRPIDTVVGYAAKPLSRANFAHEGMPGVIEGSSHDFLTDAFRAATGAQIGAIRGFRYGTHVPVGPIKYEDLFHFIPIGPQIAVGTIKGQALKNQVENSADGSLNPDVSKWTGGWLFNFSNVTMDIDPYGAAGARASNIRVGGAPLNPAGNYTYASYWYAADPGLINVVPAANISVLKDTDGSPLDGTEVVVRYLESLPGKVADPVLNRIRLVNPLPMARFGFPEVQPLRGAQP